VIAPVFAALEALAQRTELIEELKAARPLMPEQLNDRAQDITEPLIAIADMAGGDWPEKSRRALVKLYGQEEDEDKGVKLLVAIRRVFDDKQAEKLSTLDILTALVAAEDGQWASMFEDLLKHEKNQTAASRLARLLKDYRKPDGERLRPHKIRIGDETAQGFYRTDFERAWAHNLDGFPHSPHPGGTSGTSEQNASATSENACSTSEDAKWNTSGTQLYPCKNAKCSTVPAVPPTAQKPDCDTGQDQ
jgi:hypothetical protein